MAVGKAVVANDHPEQRSVIDASAAGLCVPYEEAAFAEATLELLGNSEMAREMGRRGRQYVLEHRAYGVIARTVEQALEGVARQQWDRTG
jgi:glycosyltransferase involved in cell wall biosynthesis